MSDAGTLRIDPVVSLQAQRLRLSAQLLSAAAAVACLLAAAAAADIWRVAIALGAAAAAVVVLRRAPKAAARIRVSGDGTVLVGTDEGTGGQAEVRFCSAFYVCLGAGGRTLPVWRDEMPGDDWRRLRVACLWSGRDTAGTSPVSTRGKRTK